MKNHFEKQDKRMANAIDAVVKLDWDQIMIFQASLAQHILDRYQYAQEVKAKKDAEAEASATQH